MALLKKDYSIGLCCPMIAIREKVYSAGKRTIGIQSHSQVLEGHDPSRKLSGKKGVHRRESFRSGEPQEPNPWAPKFEERTQDDTLKTERCARRDAWELAKDVYKLKKEVNRNVVLSCRNLGSAGTLVDKSGRATIRNRLWSFCACVK